MEWALDNAVEMLVMETIDHIVLWLEDIVVASYLLDGCDRQDAVDCHATKVGDEYSVFKYLASFYSIVLECKVPETVPPIFLVHL